ncbi:TetR/AcrR family transcriptional regulator [Halobacillus salinarum]|uniref:TetR/AcrR family transcriptional regulator n=1 Tax=Halobacillus salinarum TaxID=2932257 RepID=A0ABY4EPF1_9BACI|nr:TetR/AcrR family transcriptional regulator [Halobacillus salinarum]UOQ45497.1 TetR/AcrR family transcriptional regulator [Halobacillus salinarum]
MSKKFNQRNTLILNTAEELIKTHGYHEVKMSDISEKLDIAKGTLYSHYQSKEQLVFSIVKPKIDSFLSSVEEITESTLSENKKVISFINEGFLSDFFHFVLSSFPDMAAIFNEDHNSELALSQRRIISNFEQVIEAGKRNATFQTKAPADFLSLQLMQLFDPLIYQTLVSSGTMSAQNFVNQSTAFFMRAIHSKGDF